MTESVVAARELGKTFRVPERDAGLAAAVKSLFVRRHRDVNAVQSVTFDIAAGEVVGFLGPNGAGKTTTLKLLTGLLHPTAGEARVLGYLPHRRDHRYLRQVSLVMGNRNQLAWDIPASDSFEMNRAIYGVPKPQFRATLDELTAILDIGDLVRRPVRNLSLGERMRVELAGALLHRPRVLFLDEPTLGMDFEMQKRLRTFVAEYNARFGATVLLTSHYMADIEALCERVILIDNGRLRYDGSLQDLVAKAALHKEVSITLAQPGADLRAYGEVLAEQGAMVRLRIEKAEVAAVIARILAAHEVADFSVVDPPVEDIIQRFYAEG